MNLIVAGSREFNNSDQLVPYCNYFVQNNIVEGESVTVFCGGADGADKIGETWAQAMGYEVRYFYPDWSKGRGAGPMRNKKMVEEATHAIFFWNGKSNGTRDCITRCVAKGIPYQLVKFTSYQTCMTEEQIKTLKAEIAATQHLRKEINWMRLIAGETLIQLDW